MVDFANWLLSFINGMISMIFSLTSSDGYSLGYMLLAMAIVGVVISATIGSLALVSSAVNNRIGRGGKDGSD